jgi:hypothetical protein
MPEQKARSASSRWMSRASTSYLISAADSLARSKRRIETSLLPRQSLKAKVADPAGAEQRTRNMPLGITCKPNAILPVHEQVSRDGKQRQVCHLRSHDQMTVLNDHFIRPVDFVAAKDAGEILKLCDQWLIGDRAAELERFACFGSRSEPGTSRSRRNRIGSGLAIPFQLETKSTLRLTPCAVSIQHHLHR